MYLSPKKEELFGCRLCLCYPSIEEEQNHIVRIILGDEWKKFYMPISQGEAFCNYTTHQCLSQFSAS